jgi:hypothetical protein
MSKNFNPDITNHPIKTFISGLIKFRNKMTETELNPIVPRFRMNCIDSFFESDFRLCSPFCTNQRSDSDRHGADDDKFSAFGNHPFCLVYFILDVAIQPLKSTRTSAEVSCGKRTPSSRPSRPTSFPRPINALKR